MAPTAGRSALARHRRPARRCSFLWSPWAFVFVVGLLVSIFLHELGHFVTARWTGMKATQFFLFMGPKLWSFRRGETEYGLAPIPLGAFVRIIGMNNLDEVAPEDEPRAYRNKSYPRRMLVITAGSIMHILIAIALIFARLRRQRPARRRPAGSASAASSAGYPADSAGLQAGDIVLSIDGVSRRRADEFVDQIRSHSRATTVTLVIERDGADADDRRSRSGPTRRRRSVRQGVPRRRPPAARSTWNNESVGAAQPPTASSTSARRCGRASAAWSRCSTRSTSSAT